ncbi:hypothetical protein HBI04_098590 [Parastagonospora nodorum]|nr:hypothetical protein HBI03_199480 [Parastagonospora nodorum]KAH4277758.1 hypothetical protein HBI04_098590 [Parastagonospora nodorum]KAH5468409.1 hypothetical protein HBI28_185560 [Parastagonospora nodorum]KAH5620588.1 hypothetical protein HBI22_208100 [Parastagonospora nodorum]
MAHVGDDMAAINAKGGPLAWFDKNPTLDVISPELQQLLKSYSGIQQDELLDHVVKIREEAWKIHPYPCIGQFLFLENNFGENDEEYKEVIQRLGKGQKLLDMACCVGQTIRTLVHGGAPSENTFGCDLYLEFIELGYELFRDHRTLKTQFLTADVFDPSSALTEIRGQMDMIFAGDFFHLWGYEKQVEVCKIVFALLRPQSGSMILGRQFGAADPEEKQGPVGVGMMFRHNVESFEKMWRDIGDELGIRITVKAKYVYVPDRQQLFCQDNGKRFSFVVRRD